MDMHIFPRLKNRLQLYIHNEVLQYNSVTSGDRNTELTYFFFSCNRCDGYKRCIKTSPSSIKRLNPAIWHRPGASSRKAALVRAPALLPRACRKACSAKLRGELQRASP